MKTTVTITVESEERGNCYKISHEGDALGYEVNDLVTAVQLYWNKVQERENAKESLLVMKEKRKEMKQRIKDAEAYVVGAQTEGYLSKSKEQEPIPF